MTTYRIHSSIDGSTLIPSISLPQDRVESLSSDTHEGHFRAGSLDELTAAGLDAQTLVYAIVCESTMTTTPDIDHDDNKQSINTGAWESVTTFGQTFPDGDGTGACDVEVCVAQCSGYWYLLTRDDAGGSDECDATPYDSRTAAEAAAKDYASKHDECDGKSAEDWLESQIDHIIEHGKSNTGEYCLVHKDGSRWDEHRYSDRTAAETAIERWYKATQAANPGTDLVWHLMDTPELARINDSGTVEIISDED